MSRGTAWSRGGVHRCQPSRGTAWSRGGISASSQAVAVSGISGAPLGAVAFQCGTVGQ